MLTDLQKAAAAVLLAKRPATLPGTRAILDEAAQKAWHAEVTGTMDELGVTAGEDHHDKISEFCDAAGVAD